MIPFVSYDIIEHMIFPHLSFEDLKSFSKVNKYFNKKINAIYFINRKIKEIFGDDTILFKKLLQETRSVISGSFILQCLLRVEWSNSDIDIFSRDSRNKIFNFLKDKLVKVPASERDEENYVHPNKGTFTVVDFSYEKEFLDNKKIIDASKNWWKDLTELPCTYRRTPNQKNRVQLIKSSNDTPVKNLIDSFDFDILKNYYFISSKGTEKIYMFSPKDVKTRTTRFKPSLYMKQDILTTFAEHEENPPPVHARTHSEIIHSSTERAKMRIKKYEDRGIVILGLKYFINYLE